MADYIDRDAAIECVIHQYCASSDETENALGEAIEEIKALPSADVKPVVRCEECKYCRKEDEFEYWCYGFCSPARLVRKDDFCSHGCKTE